MADAPESGIYSDLSDDELILLIRAGNSDAVNTLLLRYSGSVAYIAKSYFFDSLTDDDWYQEGMIGFLHAVRTYRADKSVSFNTYASVCIRNRLIACLKKLTSLKNLPLNSAVSLEDVADVAVSSSEDDYLSNEDSRNFEQILIEHLSNTEQKVMMLYLAGYSYAEIATELNSSVKAVDNAVCRAKNKLKKIMNISS